MFLSVRYWTIGPRVTAYLTSPQTYFISRSRLLSLLCVKWGHCYFLSTVYFKSAQPPACRPNLTHRGMSPRTAGDTHCLDIWQQGNLLANI